MRLTKRLGSGLLLLATIAACGGGPLTAPSADPASCVTFEGEVVTGLEWAGDGTSIYSLTTDLGAGVVVVRQIAVPSMTWRELARRPDALALAGLALGPEGPAWIEMPASIWTAVADGPKLSVTLETSMYGLRGQPGGYLARDPEAVPSEVLFVPTRGATSVRVRSRRIIESFDVSSDGSDLVYAESDGPGTGLSFILTRDGNVTNSITPQGRLVGGPILQPGRSDIVYYEDHDDGSLKKLEVKSGKVTTVLRLDVSEPRVARDGRVAFTFVDPAKTDTVCVAGGSQ